MTIIASFLIGAIVGAALVLLWLFATMCEQLGGPEA